MKAISLWQPWAQLVVTGEKRVETRHWPTKVRGQIAIHAAKRKPDVRFPNMSSVDIPLGAIVGFAEIIDCVPIETLYGSSFDTPTERSYGDWSQGRFGWLLSEPKMLVKPIIVKGHQGFWIWNETRDENFHLQFMAD